MATVAVIGGGVMGFSTAYNLKKAYPSLDVTLLAKSFTPETCSDVAAGIWHWRPLTFGNTPIELQRKWSKATWYWAEHLSKRNDANKIGISICSGYNLYDHEIDKLPEWHDLVPTMKMLSKEDVQSRFPNQYKSGFFYTTYTIQSSKYLPWLKKCFCDLGGNIEQKTIESFDEVAGYDLVINCAGFGARKLCSDNSIVPVRGQVMRVKAPWVRHFYLCELKKQNKMAYIIPNIDWIVLGGTIQSGNFNTEVTEEDKDYILKETYSLQPDLENCVKLTEIVGLRPSRPSVRLETEDYVLKASKSPKKILKIIHNYGHGGGGITTHWGCALDVVEIVKDHLGNIQLKKAKL